MRTSIIETPSMADDISVWRDYRTELARLSESGENVADAIFIADSAIESKLNPAAIDDDFGEELDAILAM